MMNLFSREMLQLDLPVESARIEEAIRETVQKRFRKKGVVVGLSGGIDSSVVSALCVRALGPDRVFGLFMPEEDSSDESTPLGEMLSKSLGIQSVTENIGPLLRAAGCYQRRDRAIQSVIPEYNETYKSKIVLPNLLEGNTYSVYSVVVQSPDGVLTKARLTANAYLEIVAATNFKQRTRKMMEYYHADRLNFVVAGTPNRLEYDQGFFVKNGDGAADIKPIAHLYKTQVYQMAAYLNVPKEIQSRPPTTDTYSLEQSQEEFYFALPYDKLDCCLYAKNHNIPAAEVAKAIGLTDAQVERAFRDIDSKRLATRYLHSKPILMGEVNEINLG